MRDDDDKPRRPEAPDGHSDPDHPPWWAEEAPDDTPLPADFPQRPDRAKLAALQAKMKQDKASRRDPHRTRLHDRLGRDAGRSVRDIGHYTLIPMMMLAGPVMGYLVGHWVEGRFGGEPWFGVGGIVFGLVAAVRQIVIMLGRRNDRPGG
ncbi:MAG: AtpZ/AtpI family protein [Candidatus Krumholzibacteriia bacterium]